MPIKITDTGSWANTEAYLRRMKDTDIFATLDRFGAAGVAALSAATPTDSGVTAGSWSYEVKRSKTQYSISWTNSHHAGDKPLVIMLQYGHGTGTGGYVQGRDFINPAIRPIFEQMDAEMRKVVNS